MPTRIAGVVAALMPALIADSAVAAGPRGRVALPVHPAIPVGGGWQVDPAAEQGSSAIATVRRAGARS